jgi:hypothetical protein
MPLTINPWDITPIMNRIFQHSYNRPETNKNATSDRGWCPANRKLYTHPELKPEFPAAEAPTNQQEEQEPSSSIEPSP